MTDSQRLLADYVTSGSENAFREVVNRYLDLVYSTALRLVEGDEHRAEDVAQIVFVDLARTARTLPPEVMLGGWLHRHTCFVAATTMRGERRRQFRERQAVEMNALQNNSGADFSRIAPILDEAIDALGEPDRTAILLRFFEQRDFRYVGEALGSNEDAARMRVNRALGKLESLLKRHGLTSSAGALAVALTANAIQAAPVGLVASISTAAALVPLSIPAAAGAGATTGFLSALLHVSRAKLMTGFVAIALIGVTALMVFRSREQAAPSAITDPIASIAAQNQQAGSAASQTINAADMNRQPDPRNLLLAVARARQRIVSGSLEFQVTSQEFGLGRGETNQFRLVALFDVPKLRFEQFDREYSYKYSEDETEAAEITRRADSMSREAAVRAGLLKPFESHHMLVRDGEVLLNYWETDGKPSGTTIDDASKGTGQFIFDPRCLGLATVLSAGSTVENCLAYNEAKSVELVGQETVGGVPAWHVQVRSKYDALLDFWIDVARPIRVLKQAHGSNFVLSQYDDAKPRDPLPTEVVTRNFRNGSPLFNRRFLRSNSRFNVPVDPASFTLAGLGMQIGTRVSDIRISRGIGYWTGAGLSENLPPKKGPEPPPSPKLGELLSLLETDPTSTEALDAATWILLNTPDGPEVQKAADVILHEHTRDTNLTALCKELERLRHRCSKPVLEAILKDNPSDDVRGAACFALATLVKDEAKYGQNKKATAEADRLFERVITEFSQAGRAGADLARRAKPELDELRRLIIGKPAPDAEGEDLNGQSMKLGDYRGNVTVLVFWGGDFSEARDYRKLIEGMDGKPFVFLGVNCDKDLARAKSSVEKYGITWPSFRDGRDGPISTLWNSHRWPDLWVLDRQGVIRYRNVRWRDLSDAVDTLLRE